jgi:hypothetical protein
MISGYLIISMCVFIGLHNLRFGEDFTWQENLCSHTTLFLATMTFPFPFVMGAILYCKVKGPPLPDLEDLMTLKELRDIYGTIDIAKIKSEAYTKAKHTALKEKYGTMIVGHKLRKNGKFITILYPVLSLLRKLIVAWAITSFTKTP